VNLKTGGAPAPITPEARPTSMLSRPLRQSQDGHLQPSVPALPHRRLIEVGEDNLMH